MFDLTGKLSRTERLGDPLLRKAQRGVLMHDLRQARGTHQDAERAAEEAALVLQEAIELAKVCEAQVKKLEGLLFDYRD
jgi:hypothetical protein